MASGSTRGGFVMLTIGGVLAYSGIKGLSIIEVLAGERGTPLDPRGGKRGGTVPTGGGSQPTGHLGPMNSPQAVIENIVIPMARRHGIDVTVESVRAANARHSKRTLTGGLSDHSGPGSERWAIDASNGSRPTPEMDAFAEELAQTFGFQWAGKGAKSFTWQNFNGQMIYRSMVGGNHFNHVHFGLRVRRDQKR